MTKFTVIIGLAAAVAVADDTFAASLTFSSKEQRAVLLELYTSEGCSSCPPADRWLSRLKDDPRLWNQIVPVAFHVDYWNYLGWPDRFADARFSRRQEQYERYGYLQTVYTPGVVKNGREWRGWSHTGIPVSTGDKGGVLKANIHDGGIAAKFVPDHGRQSPLVLNVALLGFNLTTRVVAGENAGKFLSHDFVVLDFRQFTEAPRDGQFTWKLPGILNGAAHDRSAIALWVSAVDDPTPLQAAGTWLK